MIHPHSEIPPLDAVLDSMRVVSIPTRTRFRGITEREGAIFAGPQGASEFSPFLEYGDAEATPWLAAALDFGWAAQPATLRDCVEVNATIPAVAPDEVAGILARFPGCRTAKVKVAERGQSLADDVARVRRVRELMGPNARVRVDANTGWTTAEAVTALTALTEFELDYAEQPCVSVPELAEVRDRLRAGGVPVRIAADESVRKASDPLAVARAGAADLLIIKAQPLGGVSRALEIVREAGLPVVVSSALDTSAGIAMGAHLAAALPAELLAGACGLGTVALLTGDVTDTPILPVQGMIPVSRPVLSETRLSHYAAAPDRVEWWRQRVTSCHALLAGPRDPA